MLEPPICSARSEKPGSFRPLGEYNRSSDGNIGEAALTLGFDEVWRAHVGQRWRVERAATWAQHWLRGRSNLRQKQHALVRQATFTQRPSTLCESAVCEQLLLCFRPCRLSDQSGRATIEESRFVHQIANPGNRVCHPVWLALPGPSSRSAPGRRRIRSL